MDNIQDDILSQTKARRSLERDIRELIVEITRAGLQGESVIAALEGILAQERDLKKSRDAFARMYV